MSKFCKNCGAEVKEGNKFCMSCGAPVAEQTSPVQQPMSYAAEPKSGFDGGVLETFVALLVFSLITSITCGIGTPWALCYFIKYITSHVYIDGKRYVFTGDGTNLFGQYIIWLLLTFITCGIYSFWVVPKLYNWIFKNIHQA